MFDPVMSMTGKRAEVLVTEMLFRELQIKMYISAEILISFYKMFIMIIVLQEKNVL